MSSTASLASLRWYSASNLCMAARCSSVIIWLRAECEDRPASLKRSMRLMSLSNPSGATEQNFDNRNRQCDEDDHHHHVAQRDRRIGFSIGDDDGLRWHYLRDIGPAFDPWCHRYQGLGFIGGHCVRRSAQVWRWDRDHEAWRRLGLRMMHAMANPMGTRRCRVPTMLGAMPIEVHRTKMLTRFGLAQAGR